MVALNLVLHMLWYDVWWDKNNDVSFLTNKKTKCNLLAFFLRVLISFITLLSFELIGYSYYLGLRFTSINNRLIIIIGMFKDTFRKFIEKYMLNESNNFNLIYYRAVRVILFLEMTLF